MIGYEKMLEIRILHRQGYGIKKISRELGLSRNTVRRYLRDLGLSPCYKGRAKRIGKLEAYKGYIDRQVLAALPDRIPSTVLYREIVCQGYKGCIGLLRSYVKKLVDSQKVFVPVVRFETSPGKQMQVDWAEMRMGRDRLCAFVATLGYSRMSFVKFVRDEKIETLLECLDAAFDYFGGVVERVLFDNMKTVVIARNAYGEGIHRFHPKLWDYAKHHGFLPRLCSPYRAQTKGKVERFIGYLRRSFYVPLRTKMRLLDLVVDEITANSSVKEWLNEVANSRVHATTGERPVDRWQEERLLLGEYRAYGYAKRTTPQEERMPLHPSSFAADRADTVITLQHDLSIYQQLLTLQRKENSDGFTT